MTKMPWGFKEHGGHLVATEAAAARFRRAELGEAALSLLALLGVSEEWLVQIAASADPLAALAALQGETP